MSEQEEEEEEKGREKKMEKKVVKLEDIVFERKRKRNIGL
jgi:hypothetical protein